MSKLSAIFPAKGDREKVLSSLSGFDWANLLRVALSCSRRGNTAESFSWRAVLHLTWDTLYVDISRNKRQRSRDSIVQSKTASFEVQRNALIIPVHTIGEYVKDLNAHLLCEVRKVSATPTNRTDLGSWLFLVLGLPGGLVGRHHVLDVDECLRAPSSSRLPSIII
jgi:hypothetical protein